MKTFFVSFTAALITIFSALPSFASGKSQYLAERFERLQNLAAGRNWQADFALETKTGEFDQRLDHERTSDMRTFKQRYHVNSENATRSDAPVLYYICGEATCDASALSKKTLVDFAKALGAHLVTLEHRYYGKSQPFARLTVDNLKYLSTDAALKDLAAFEDHARTALGMTGKWIAVGGSYAGSLAAYYRMKFPDMVVGALSSSGPVQARALFEEYDRHVATVAGPDCAKRIRSVVADIESQLGNPARLKEIKTMFGAQDVTDTVDFLYVVADMAAVAIQYGNTDKFCQALDVQDPLAGYATVGTELFANFGMTPFMDSFQAAENDDPYAYQDFALRQWMYQSCTEYGYYQVAHHDSQVTVRSRRIDLAYHNQVCDRLFSLKRQVDEDSTNARYFKPLLDPSISRIFFTNGTDDPWTNLSLTNELGNNTNPNLELMTIKGAAHCADLSGRQTPELTVARDRFLTLAREWLQ